ncbi:MAG TPA: hypothetical protein VMX13_12260 [Sedimentisphaerales bacterium]|nr:hypothetical protein [Sedimentisphaerales bacterium]
MISHIPRLTFSGFETDRLAHRGAIALTLIVLAVFAGLAAEPTYGANLNLPQDGGAADADNGSPNIHVPYQDLARLIEPQDKAILMDRVEFERLLAAARAGAEGAETLELGQVSRAEYTGTISRDQLVLTGALEVECMGEGPVAVAMAFGQVGLTIVTLDNKPAPLGYDKQGRLTLIVTGRGEHRLEIAGSTKLKELSTGGMQFSLSLPAAVAGKMKLSAQGDLEMHATVPLSQPKYDKDTDSTSVELTIGGQDRLTVVLLGNGRQEDERAILLGESACSVNLSRSHQWMSCLYTVQILRRGVRELEFGLPGEWTVTEVTSAGLVQWSVGQAREPLGQQRLTVRLRSAKVGTTALHIKAAASRAEGAWRAPRVSLAGAAFERGYVMVNTDEELRVRSEELVQACREDASAASVPGIVSTSAGRLYFYWGDKWSVALELAVAALRRSIKEHQSVTVSAEQLTLTGDFEVTAIDRELFDISFVLPAQAEQWNLRTVRVNNKRKGFEYQINEEGGRRLLRIELARPVMPEKVANVRIELQHVPPDWQWPSDAAERSIKAPLIESQADSISGHVLISAKGNLDAEPATTPDGMEAVPVARMSSLQIPGEFQHAYSYKTPAKGWVELKVSRRRPRVEANAVGLITVRPDGLKGNWRINYAISRASAKTLYLLADRSLEEQISITSSGPDISSKHIVAAGEETVPCPAELARRYNLWLLTLDHDGFGEVAIDVHYERPLPSDKFSAPLIRPIGQGRTNEVLAVQASEELALTIQAAGVKEMDAIDLPPLPGPASRILGAYRLEATATAAGCDAAVMLDTAVHQSYPVPSALAVAGELTTYLDRQGGQRTQAVFRIANVGQQFLTFRLPKGAELWSLRVGNQQAKPQHNAQGDYQVPLGKSREPVAVKIVYAYRPGESSLDELELGGVEIPGVETNRMRWSVIPPPGYQITSQQTKMESRDLRRARPACLDVYDFLRRNLLRGSLWWFTSRIQLMQTLSTAGETDVYRFEGGTPAAVEVAEEPAPRGAVAYSDVQLRIKGRDERRRAEREQAERRKKAVAYGGGVYYFDSTHAPVVDMDGDAVKGEPTPQPPPAKTVTARTDGLGLAAEGRFTLPVELVPTPGAGPAARFSGLGAARLVVGLTRQYRRSSSWLLGLLLIVMVGVATASKGARDKVKLLVLILLAASLWAIWRPAGADFANGAFTGGLLLVPLYLSIALMRWLLPRCRLGAAVGGTAAKAVGIVVLILVFGFMTQAAQAAKAEQSAESVSRKGPPEDDRIALPPMIIPYDGDPTTAEKSDKVLIPYSRYIKLWNQAHPEDPIDGLKPGADISLAGVRYKGTVDNKQLKLVLTAQVRTYGKEWVVLALPAKGLAVTEVTFDGRPAQWQGAPALVGEDKQVKDPTTGMVVMLPGEASGLLELHAVGTPFYQGRRAGISFTLPPLPAAVMTVTLPEEDLELEVEEIDGTPTRRAVNGGVEWTVPLGMRRELKLSWAPKESGGAADRTLSAASEHDVYAFHWSLVGVTKITYSFSAGERDRFSVSVPKGATLTALEGANIRDFRQAGEQTIDSEVFKTVEVRLHRPAKKQYELTARWLSELPPLEQPSPLSLVRAGQVSRESGTVTLHSAGGMTMKVVEVSGGRRTNMESAAAAITAGQTQPVARYYWPYRPFSLSLQISRPPVIAKVSLDQLVRVSSDQVQLLVEAKVRTDLGRVFGADLMLPEGYELLSVVGPLVENFHERQTPKGRLLHVKFSSATQQTTMALVLLSSKVELESFRAPTISAVDAQGVPLPEQQGRIAVQVAAALDAQTVSSENLKSVEPQSLRDWLDQNQVRAVQFAYRYEAANPSLLLNIRPQPTHIRVEVFAGLVVKAASADYTYRLRYDITGTPIDHLRFQMPSEYAPLVAVDSPAKRSITQFVAEEGQTGWDVSFMNEVAGTVDITVNFGLPVDESTKVLEVPRIDTEAPAGYRAIAAIQNISRHEIYLKDKTKLDNLPASEQRELIPEQMRDSLQYVLDSFESGWSLSLNFKPAKAAARIQAVVDLLALTTVVDRDGRCRYEARLALQNRNEQFLRVSVPRGLRLWSATVAEQPVKPVTAAGLPDGEVLVPLVKTSPGGLPYDVYLYFADDGAERLVAPLNGITRLEPPAISIVGIQVMQTTWSLRLPGGYHYVRPGGNMSRVAGTVEMLSLNIEAKLKQLERLDKTYREIAGTAGQREEITRQNWDAFNRKLAGEIKGAQQYLISNRDEVAAEDYDRLKSKLARQETIQDTVIWGNGAFVEQQQELGSNNMNIYINDNASNAGAPSGGGLYVEALQEEPEFVNRNFRGNVARLQNDLEVSEQQRKDLEQTMQQGGNGDMLVINGTLARAGDSIIVAGAGDKQAQMGKILEELNRDNEAQVRMQQEQLANQLSIIEDNRYVRMVQRSGGKAGGPQAAMTPPPAPRPAPAGPAGQSEGTQVAVQLDDYEAYKAKKWSGTDKDGEKADETEPATRGEYAGGLITSYSQTQAGVPVLGRGFRGREQAGLERGDPVQPYVATGTYSLPVSLPEGEVRLDFARPGADARLTIWAVPTRMLQTLYATIAVIGAALVLLGLIRIWPHSVTPRKMSVKRIVIYIVLFVVLAVFLGLLGVIISIAGILITEAVRSSWRRPAEAVA